MSGLIYVPSTDIDDGGKTRIGGHFFRKEFLPDVSLNSLGKWMYHTGNHFLSIIHLYYTEKIKRQQYR